MRWVSAANALRSAFVPPAASLAKAAPSASWDFLHVLDVSRVELVGGQGADLVETRLKFGVERRGKGEPVLLHDGLELAADELVVVRLGVGLVLRSWVVALVSATLASSTSYMPPWDTLATKALSASESGSAACRIETEERASSVRPVAAGVSAVRRIMGYPLPTTAAMQSEECGGCRFINRSWVVNRTSGSVCSFFPSS